MTSLSVCMIVKDEENSLENSIKSILPIADELVIIDTGSADQTKAIAKKFTNKVYDFDWTQDFAVARNFSLSFATKKYILFWDADFEIDKKSLKNFKNLKSKKFENLHILSFFWEDGPENLIPRHFLFRNKKCLGTKFSFPLSQKKDKISKF